MHIYSRKILITYKHNPIDLSECEMEKGYQK